MAGIPPFAGFFIKLNILIGLESSERNALVFLVLLFTVLSLFYYLRLIKIIQFDNISFNFYTNFVKPNVLFFASLFIFVLIFFIFLINQNLLVIFQEAFLTSKISDLQNLDQTLLNIEFDEDH
jgi:NADH-quinone oxidoreductase subunit N